MAVSRALAADDLGRFNEHIARLPSVLALVPKEVAAPRHWEGFVERLADLGKGKPAKDLAEARGRFLPFSTATVDLAKALKKEGEPFTGLKIYHCPTATRPELWMQAKGPPRNPFQGPKEPVCGEEVKP